MPRCVVGNGLVGMAVAANTTEMREADGRECQHRPNSEVTIAQERGGATGLNRGLLLGQRASWIEGGGVKFLIS